MKSDDVRDVEGEVSVPRMRTNPARYRSAITAADAFYNIAVSAGGSSRVMRNPNRTMRARPEMETEAQENDQETTKFNRFRKRTTRFRTRPSGLLNQTFPCPAVAQWHP